MEGTHALGDELGGVAAEFRLALRGDDQGSLLDGFVGLDGRWDRGGRVASRRLVALQTLIHR
ncbi:hypothetical protein ASPZODRAFT_507592 [Penicilliopsis zonata CBS 506.65]|uniref:Uncharacterized protein n=1 Tax=Penicilliopsis zonata CBS 506.65 TaxID=1073090 RepID=A0A1L9SEU3_9EURO|nr:hypothetical protein ASPZODRAFT_507592 [Penicilliopsis zonata CBS 506.65]OJJ45668.1 hypothetical protein ASPZODRAFT_507592 [Penicilliopsis zonata CBS 506.65]